MFRPYGSVRTVSRLSREDWASAALDALGSRGLAAVAVEPLAVGLGATKGSFYWHFRNRDELIAAALELWRQASTTAVIERVEAADASPDQRLRQLFAQVFAASARTSSDLALLADADHPLVAPVLASVTEQRLDYVTTLFEQLGFAPTTARRRALLAYSAYLGHLQLMRSAPGILPSGTTGSSHADTGRAESAQAASAYADEVLAVLLA